MKLQPSLRFEGPWRALRGRIRGLQQPALIGRLRAAAPLPDDAAARLDAAMQAVHPQAQPPALGGQAAPDLARRVAFWTGELQRHANIGVSPRYHVGPNEEPQAEGGLFALALPCAAAAATQVALEAVVNVANHLLAAAPEGQGHAQALLAALPAKLQAHAEAGFNRFFMMDAAFRLDLPLERVGSVLLLGTGRHLRMMESSVTDATPALGLSLAQDKQRSADVLRMLGLPGPVHEVAKSAAQAVEIAHRLGYPVVVKPADQDQGRGVAAGLRSDGAVERAFADAAAVSRKVLVEKHFEGKGYRLTVLYGEVVGVIRRWPGGVTGDGVHTIEQLLARRELPLDVRGSPTMGRLALDAQALEMLQEQGLTPQSIPAAGAEVPMRRRDNVSTGGGYEHLPVEAVHPDNRELACRAARALGLDLSGIDILIADIGRSWHEIGALLCEINARPQFVPGPDGRMFDRVLSRIVGPQAAIPFHVLVCRQPNAPGLREALQARQAELGCDTLACQEGVWRQGRRATGAFADGWQAAYAALRDRDAGSLVAALSLDEILSMGLPVHRVDSVRLAPDVGEADPARLRLALAWCDVAPDAVRRN